MYLIYSIVVITASLALAIPTFGLSLIAPFLLLNIELIFKAKGDFDKTKD